MRFPPMPATRQRPRPRCTSLPFPLARLKEHMREFWMPRRHWAASLALAALCACASAQGSYVWVDQYVAADPPAASYIIGTGDVISVQVYDNDKISTKARVRSDGRISIPLLDDVEVADKTPEEAARDVELRLRKSNLVLNPHVTIQLEEVNKVVVSVLGRVSKPGQYLLEPGSGVAEAIASAGGLTDFAHKDQIYVRRTNPKLVRIRFTFQSITSQTGTAPLFRLQAGDVVDID